MTSVPGAPSRRYEKVRLLTLIEADIGRGTPPPRGAMGVKGVCFVFPCPWCSMNRMIVNTEWDLWHCFACSMGGDALGWLIKHRGMGFTDALDVTGAPRA